MDMGTEIFAEGKRSKVPQYLEDNLARISAITNEQRTRNEAFSRTVLDQILISALYEESHNKSYQQPDSSQVMSHAHPHQQDIDQNEDPAQLQLLHETNLSKRVTYMGRSRMLTGSADYSIWYESMEKQSMATNLIIVEAKREFATDAALSQLICYMGIVHTTRKQEMRENCKVYGFTSDGKSFRFCEIDNNSNFRTSSQLEWRSRREQIFYIIRHLIRAAALSSPSTSPIMDPEKRKIVLSAFGSAGVPLEYDLPDEDEDED
jgi:hypothetical protein